MSTFETIFIIVTTVGFTAACLLALVRVVVGPTILDRIVATDMLLTTLMLAVGAEMVVNNHTDTIPLMVVLSATAIYATVMVARYVKRRDDVKEFEHEEPHV